MRRGEQPDAQTCRAINAFQHGAGGAFAVGAGDMDEAELVLRVSGQNRELQSVFQPELRAEQTQVVEKLNGFGVGHQYSGGMFANKPVELADGDNFCAPEFARFAEIPVACDQKVRIGCQGARQKFGVLDVAGEKSRNCDRPFRDGGSEAFFPFLQDGFGQGKFRAAKHFAVFRQNFPGSHPFKIRVGDDKQ